MIGTLLESLDIITMKQKTPKLPDSFTLQETYINVKSGSGKDYIITKSSCTCVGYNFHRECRHYKQARELGLIEQLEKQHAQKLSITVSEHARVLRKEAIKQFLKKKQVAFTESIIDKIEKAMTSTMKPEDILRMVVENE